MERFSRKSMARRMQREADRIRRLEKLDDRIGTIQLWDRSRLLSHVETERLLQRAVEYGKAEALESFAAEIYDGNRWD